MSSRWPATRARWVLAALERQGWRVARQKGSHRILVREGDRPVMFAFHDRETIGPAMLAKIARATGLRPEDL
jgi:predicted RNA binding protein YcfA (HicA-like mRNA interferase family)